MSTAINFAVGYLLLREGRRTESIVLEADGHHLMTDVWTTIGVVAGLLLVLDAASRGWIPCWRSWWRRTSCASG